MKDIRVKQTSLFIEKDILQHAYICECIVDNINTKKFIKAIEEGINHPDNMNYKTNAHGFMTSWQYFVNDPELNSLLSLMIDHFELDSRIGKCYLHSAWGIKMVANSYTRPHHHLGGDVILSGILYLNTLKGHYLELPDFKKNIEVVKNKVVLFKSNVTHSTKRITSINKAKYAISFNFKNNKSW